jgi:hypothetical protein
MTSRAPLLAAAIALALAGCSPDSAEKDTAAEATRAPPAQVPAAKARQALAAGDVEGAGLTGELACAFTERGAEGPLLVAQADVTDEARAQGVLRLGPSTLRLSADKDGGFNAMVGGVRFISGDLEARVTVTSNAPVGGGEAPPLPARLEITSDAGVEQIGGEWTCGP